MKKTDMTKFLLVIAACLLVFSGVEGSKAALNITSDTFEGKIVMPEVGVELTGKNVDQDGVQITLNSDVVLGKIYDEQIELKNTGTIDAYVRATVVTYWEKPDDNGEFKKDITVDPTTIVPVYEDGWTVNKAQCTAERTVLYRKTSLAPKVTDSIIKGMYLDESLANKCRVIKEQNGNQKLVYAYDGYRLVVKVTVDALQCGGQKDSSAVESSWGVSADDLRKLGVEINPNREAGA